MSSKGSGAFFEKDQHPGTSLPYFQSLWEARSPVSFRALFQLVKLPSVITVGEGLLFLWVKPISLLLISEFTNPPALCPFSRVSSDFILFPLPYCGSLEKVFLAPLTFWCNCFHCESCLLSRLHRRIGILSSLSIMFPNNTYICGLSLFKT